MNTQSMAMYRSGLVKGLVPVENDSDSSSTYVTGIWVPGVEPQVRLYNDLVPIAQFFLDSGPKWLYSAYTRARRNMR